jgi:VWFA-related protein
MHLRLTLLALLVSTLAAAQQPHPSTSKQPLVSGATAVVVDVVVRDNRGNPVTDLRKEEFELIEDGVLQEIGDFTVVAGAGAARLPAAGVAATGGAGRAGAPPSFTAIVFNRLSPEARSLAYEGARACLETLQDGDVIGVFATDRSLMIIHPYTTDKASVRKALDAAGGRSAWSSPQVYSLLDQPGPPGPPPAGAAVDSPAALAAAIQKGTEAAWKALDELYEGYSTTDALLAIASALSVLPGRKSVVFFSEGIPVPDPVLHHFTNAIAATNRANVSVYTIDAAGLRASSQQSETAGRVSVGGSAGVGDALRSPTEMLSRLARDTGGVFVENTNDLRGAFRRVDADRRYYYLLTYTPKNANFDGKWRSINVKVPGRRLDIRARTGYLATKGPGLLPFLTLLEYEAPALDALARSPAPADIPLRAAAFVFPGAGQARLAILAATDAAALRFDADTATGRFRTDFTILARILNDRGEVVRKASQPYRLSGEATQLEQAKRGEVLFFRQPSLEPGSYTLEVALHDALAGHSSVHRSSVVVPDTKAAPLQVSSLVLVRHAERVKPEERDRDNPLYTGDVLVYPNLGEPIENSREKAATFFVVATAPPDSMPKAVLEVLLEGRAIAKAPLAFPAIGSAGRAEHVFQLPLEQLAAGRYTVRLTVAHGDAREVREAVMTTR